MMTRPDLETVPAAYKVYVDYVKDYNLPDALRLAGSQTQEILLTIPDEKGTYRYQEGKWSIKEVLNHIMDAERVFAYRALRFARKDQTPLHPFDENEYAPEANAHSRSILKLAREMQWLRETTLDLFESFTPEMLNRQGTASGKMISVLNLGYVIAGHDIHHCKIIHERYLNR